MSDFKEKLKNAICNNDLEFITKNRVSFDINERFEDEDNDTLLLYSISDSKSNAFQYFLDNGADYGLANDLKETVLHAIVYSGDILRLVEFLNRFKFNLNGQSSDGSTPLLLAISLNRYDMAKELIIHGADVDLCDDDDISPLHLASESDDYELVKLIINAGGDIRKKTKSGNLPLALAVNNSDNPDIAKLLFKMMYADI